MKRARSRPGRDEFGSAAIHANPIAEDSFEIEEKRDSSLRRPTLSQERKGKKKSTCSVRNDVVVWFAELQLEGLEGDVLGGDEEFAAESTFGGAAI